MDENIIQKGNKILNDISARAAMKYDRENNSTAKICYLSDTEEEILVKTVSETVSSLEYYINNMDTGSAGPKQEYERLIQLRYDLTNYNNPLFPKTKEEINKSVKIVNDSIQKITSTMREHDNLKSYLKAALRAMELDLKVVKLTV